MAELSRYIISEQIEAENHKVMNNSFEIKYMRTLCLSSGTQESRLELISCWSKAIQTNQLTL